MANNTELSIVVKAKDEATDKINKVKGSLSGLGEGIAVAGKAMAAFGIAAAAAAGAFAVKSIKDFSEVGDAVEKMSKRTGMGAEAVSAMRVAAQMGGTSIDAMEVAVKKMQLGMEGFNAKGSAMKKVLEENNIKFETLRTMKPEQQFEMIGNAIGNIEDPARRTALMVEAFGKSGTELIPTFEGGAFSMAAWTKEAEKLGVKFDDISANKAAQLNDAIGAMQTAWNGLKLKVGGELAPVITDLINNKLIPLAQTVLASLPSLKQIHDAYENLRQRFVDAMDEFDKRSGIITRLREIFTELWTHLETELMPAIMKLWEASKPLQPLFEALAKVIGAVLIIALRALVEVLGATLSLVTWIITKGVELQTAFLEVIKPATDVVAAGLNYLNQVLQWVIDKFNAMRAAALAALEAARKAAASVGLGGGNTSPSGGGGGGKAFASGGIVTGPTMALIGEAGPEAVVPLREKNAGAFAGLGGGTTVNVSIGNFYGGSGDRAARELGDLIVKRLQLNARLAT